MNKVIGIDTGGTFTDSVIYDYDSEQILASSKTPTTVENLKECINNVLDKLPQEHMKDVSTVSLSTTLVTNACVEGKGAKGKLILIGSKSEEIEKYGKDYGFPSTDEILFVEGEVDTQGKIISTPDWEQFNIDIESSKNSVDGYAIVQVFGVINPVFELKAKKIIEEVTNKPVICGHELSSKLNYMRRAVSCLLNCRIVPLFNNFLDAIKDNLLKRNMDVKIIIVRSDGSIMTEEYARQKPVDTLLSGPAASVCGALRLSGLDKGIVLDMGGTTSDLAIVENNQVKMEEAGANISGYKTSTPSIDMSTIGLGGDSEIILDKNDNILVGPRRVVPICTLASKYPIIKNYLKELIKKGESHSRPLGIFYNLIKSKDKIGYYDSLTDQEKAIIEALNNGPMDITSLCKICKISIYNLKIEGLIDNSIIMKSSLTPTDIMHVKGDFYHWDVEASTLATKQFSLQYEIDEQELYKRIYDTVCSNLYLMIADKLMDYDNIMQLPIRSSNKHEYEKKISLQTEAKLLKHAFTSQGKYCNIDIKTNLPIIGIGAPAKIFLPKVAEKLGTKCYVPDYAHVANAMGAASGEISVSIDIIINPVYENNTFLYYNVITPKGINHYKEYDDAYKAAYEKTSLYTKEIAIERGAIEPCVTITETEKRAKISNNNDNKIQKNFLISVILTGKANCNLADTKAL
ncbi:hydantoinase/oxoprolinase [Vallitalea longa]|uniref:Hydantoinase/oxoprolinase n=1 Tax=Vallitalea longa TaxID=2936439 RepID=A0A9W5YCW2_9FIRM|nr:hydantoinase/oxoprolinase family protein [Vallitalea longa]GKX30749.1 hydantoinase/oxoprolinase [Vallitalea longa]